MHMQRVKWIKGYQGSSESVFDVSLSSEHDGEWLGRETCCIHLRMLAFLVFFSFVSKETFKDSHNDHSDTLDSDDYM